MIKAKSNLENESPLYCVTESLLKQKRFFFFSEVDRIKVKERELDRSRNLESKRDLLTR